LETRPAAIDARPACAWRLTFVHRLLGPVTPGAVVRPRRLRRRLRAVVRSAA
jgi:hypothetical protein